MSLSKRSTSRAESARINGAKSRGPKTPEGLYRSQTARYKNGLYSTHPYRLPGESAEEYANLQAQMRAFWQPKGFYDEQLVEQLAGNLWETWRIQAAKNDNVLEELATVTRHSPHCRDQAKLNLVAEIQASAAGGSTERACARLSHLSRERDRIERALLRLEKRPATSGPSQMPLIINGRQHPDVPESYDAQPVEGSLAAGAYSTRAGSEPLPESFPAPVPATTLEPLSQNAAPPEPITEWARTALDFHPDSVQRQIMEAQSTRILVLAPRQTGKSTAAAVRVIHEAVHKANATILLASASGRQSGQILQKARQLARQLELDIYGPPAGCDGFTLANGSSIVALPDSESTIRGFSAPSLIIVDEAAFASDPLFKALEPMLTVSNGTLMLLSTPNGQLGHFYDQWHLEPCPWVRIFGTLADCPRVNPEAIERIKASMCKEDFQQEFECKFVCAGGQFISMETVRKCLRDDFEPFCPDWDAE